MSKPEKSPNNTRKERDAIGNIQKYAYGSMVVFAFFSAISIAGVNIALGVAALFVLCGIYRKEIYAPCIDKTIARACFVFLLTVLISAIGALQPWATVERALNYFFRMLPFFFVPFICQEKKQLWMLLGVGSLSLLIADLYALLQGIHGNLRAPAFHSHPMMLAGFLVQWIPILTLATAADWGKQLPLKKSWRLGLGFLWLLSLAALIVNGTRGAWLAVIFLLMLLGVTLLRKYKKALAAGIVVFALLIGIAGQHGGLQERVHTLGDASFQSNSERLLMWQSAWAMFLDHPLVGVGAQNYEYQYQNHYISPLAKERGQMHAHSNIFQILAEQGVVGFSAFCLLFGLILWRGWRGMRRGSFWGYLLMVATVGILLQGLTEFNFGNAAVIRLYWFFAGLAMAGIKISEQDDF